MPNHTLQERLRIYSKNWDGKFYLTRLIRLISKNYLSSTDLELKIRPLDKDTVVSKLAVGLLKMFFVSVIINVGDSIFDSK